MISKANLKLTVQRLRLQKKKRGNLADNEKRVVADFLAKGADDEGRFSLLFGCQLRWIHHTMFMIL